MRDEELELARTLGADAVVNVAEQDAEEETRKLAAGGLDVVVETAGAVPAVELRRGSCAKAAASSSSESRARASELTLPADRIPLRDLSILGSVGYSTAAWATWSPSCARASSISIRSSPTAFRSSGSRTRSL